MWPLATDVVWVCLSVGCNSEPYKYGWTYRDAVGVVDLGGPMESCIRWRPRSPPWGDCSPHWNALDCVSSKHSSSKGLGTVHNGQYAASEWTHPPRGWQVWGWCCPSVKILWPLPVLNSAYPVKHLVAMLCADLLEAFMECTTNVTDATTTVHNCVKQVATVMVVSRPHCRMLPSCDSLSILTFGHICPPLKSALPVDPVRDLGPHLIHWLFGPQVHILNGISNSSPFFAWLTKCVQETEWQTTQNNELHLSWLMSA